MVLILWFDGSSADCGWWFDEWVLELGCCDEERVMIVVGDFLFAGKKIREKQKGIVLWP